MHRTCPAALALLLLLAGCAGSVLGPPAPSRPNPRALIDSYLIARGMAFGYGRSGRAGPAEIGQLIQYDRAAMLAVADAMLEPGRAHTLQAQSAVTAMLRYTGDQDLSGMPAPDALSR
jgi:hypothetical protein